MTRYFTAQNIEDYTDPAKFIVDLMDRHTVFLLKGELGAGKTTLVNKIVELIGTEDVVSSPTFALINPYLTQKGMVYHMDMYRIKLAEEAVDFGVEEYLWEGHYCFIEWPERIEQLIPDEYVNIEIEQKNSLTREIKVSVVDHNS
jgi:tRNA threonylcarbamoyladenosine biosynthesis protein TsaE